MNEIMLFLRREITLVPGRPMPVPQVQPSRPRLDGPETNGGGTECGKDKQFSSGHL